jgi:beta-N-acetylhexosaminidase
VTGLRPLSRRVGVLMLVAAAAGAAVALLTGPGSRHALPPGGSRFGTATRTATRHASLIDAMAPLLAEGSSRRAPATGSGVTFSLARGVGQLFAVGVSGTTAGAATLARLRLHDWGAVVLGRSNYVSPAQVSQLVAAIDAAARAAGHDPPLVIARQGGGDSSAFPGLAPASEPELGAVGRADLVSGQAQLAARELRALHVDATLAPIADLGDLAGPAQGRAYADDPRKVAVLTRAAVQGYRRGGLISIVGHFPGEGAASQDPGAGPATVGLRLSDLLARDVVPFRAVVDVAPMIQMSNALYAAFDGVTPASLLPDAVSLLRDRLGYRGVIVSGDLSPATLASGSSVAQAAVAALRAGDDLLYLTDPVKAMAAYDAVLVAIRDRSLDAIAIARSIARVVAIKRAYQIR